MSEFRVAPPGFTPEQWSTFLEDGIVIVEHDPVLTDLIDHDRHIGYAYDIYGELLKIHQSQLLLAYASGKTQQSVAS